MTTFAKSVSIPRAKRMKPVVFRLIVLGVMCIAAIFLRMTIGQYIGWPSNAIVLDLRLTAVVLSLIVGVALATSGVALQSLLRNPLAEPFILGLSSGAAFGVMAQLLLEHGGHLPVLPQHFGALSGALLSMLVVYLAGRYRGMIDPLHLLLTGVVLGTINGAMIMVMDYMSGPGELRTNLLKWMMGYLNQNLSIVSVEVFVSAGVTIAGLVLLLMYSRAMDVAAFSDAQAISMGVNLRLLRGLLFLIASVLAAAAVTLAGPVSFVGLISPHIARLVLGPGHRTLLIGSACIGATIILLASTASEAIDMVFNYGSLPIGIFTAVLGGPVFLWMLRARLVRTHE